MSSDTDSPETDDKDATLRRLQDRAAASVPEAVWGTSYGMDALIYRGKPLISVITTKAGFSVYPFSSSVVSLVTPELDGLIVTKGGAKFTTAAPISDAAFDHLVSARRAEIDAALGAA